MSVYPIDSTPAHTFGSVLRGMEWPDLSVEEVLMPPGLDVAEHRHNGAQIYFVLEGDYVERQQGNEYRLGPGSAWFRPPRERHENSVVGDEPVLTLIVTIEGERLARLGRLTHESTYLQSVILNEVRSEILREIRAGDATAAVALEGWTLLLLSHTERMLSDAGARAPEWLGAAIQFIERSYRTPVSLVSVARHVAVHPATLAAAFRRYHHRSVGEWIRDLRLRYAHEALVSTSRPIKEIALEAGF
jgi:AraC-like DNA-binding protein/quercetin dioxygenase-like cupin family protein